MHILLIQEHPLVVLSDWLPFLFAKWMDKNAKEPSLANYVFLVSNSIHAASKNLIKSDSNHFV